MTDTAPLTDQAPDPAESPDAEGAPTTTDPATTEVAEPDTANTEAAKYRRRLRDTEAQLQTTTDQLIAYQRRHAELAVSDVLAQPGDLWDVGKANLGDFLDDTGELRTDELRAAAEQLAEQRPQLGRNYSPPWPGDTDFGIGVRSQSVGDNAPSWAKALDPQRRQ